MQMMDSSCSSSSATTDDTEFIVENVSSHDTVENWRRHPQLAGLVNNRRFNPYEIRYRVHWRGYNDDTLEPEENLEDCDQFISYIEAHPEVLQLKDQLKTRAAAWNQSSSAATHTQTTTTASNSRLHTSDFELPLPNIAAANTTVKGQSSPACTASLPSASLVDQPILSNSRQLLRDMDAATTSGDVPQEYNEWRAALKQLVYMCAVDVETTFGTASHLPLPIEDLPSDWLMENARYASGGAGLDVNNSTALNDWFKQLHQKQSDNSVALPERIRAAALLADDESFGKLWTELRSKHETHDKAFDSLFTQTLNSETHTTLLHTLCWQRTHNNCVGSSSMHVASCEMLGVLLGIVPNTSIGVKWLNAHTRHARWTPLMLAAHAGSVCQIRKLLHKARAGASVGRLGRNDESAFSLAFGRRNLSAVRLLLWHGANVSACVPLSVRLCPPASDQDESSCAIGWLLRRHEATQQMVNQWITHDTALFDLQADASLCEYQTVPLKEATKGLELLVSITHPNGPKRKGVKPLLFINCAQFVKSEKETDPASEPNLVRLNIEKCLKNIEVWYNNAELKLLAATKHSLLFGCDKLCYGQQKFHLLARSEVSLDKLPDTGVLQMQLVLCRQTIQS